MEWNGMEWNGRWNGMESQTYIHLQAPKHIMLKQQILWSVALFLICGEYVQDQIGFSSDEMELQ